MSSAEQPKEAIPEAKEKPVEFPVQYALKCDLCPQVTYFSLEGGGPTSASIRAGKNGWRTIGTQPKKIVVCPDCRRSIKERVG